MQGRCVFFEVYIVCCLVTLDVDAVTRQGGELMKDQDHIVVRHVVDSLVREWSVERIILFGSRAREDGDEDSDYDFLVVMDTDVKPSRRGIVIRQQALIPGIPMDFMVRTPDEWTRGATPKSGLGYIF